MLACTPTCHACMRASVGLCLSLSSYLDVSSAECRRARMCLSSDPSSSLHIAEVSMRYFLKRIASTSTF